MQEIISELNSMGFFPDSIVPDKKIRRFKRQPQDKHHDAWYVAFENYTHSGEKYLLYVGGDWREPGLEVKVTSKKNLSKIDKKMVEIQIEETKQELENERLKLQEKCIQECDHIWSTSSDFSDTEYTKKKKIKGNFNVKIKDGALIVPVKTIDEKLVGLQKIYKDGKKYFHPGTAKKGAFHVIGDNINGEVYICEGFATGASVHMATGKPVVVAFDAGNLTPVAKEIRKAYRDTKVIICGDDDRGTENNPGRTMAEKAAKESFATAVFPSFESKKTTLTDFNDLHCEEGIEKVRNILLGTKAEKHYLKALGTSGEKFFYISSQGNQVIPLTSGGHNKNNLFRLMPVSYWEAIYEGKRGTKWDQAFSDLMNQCHQVGPFNPEKIRGVGVWEDRGKLVLNTGNGIYCDGRIHGVGELQTKYIYQSGPKIKTPDAKTLSVEECKPLIDAASHMNWKKDDSVFLICGFLALAPFCGALQWRPHMWITGGFGSGKSTVMEWFVRAVLGDTSLYFLGNTTEAGIRQSVGYDARPVIFDEFETVDNTTDVRVKSVLDLIRQASSESDARIAKGSAGGSAIDYRATFCAIVSSIQVNLTNGADKSRFSVLELEKVEKNTQQWELLRKKLDVLDSNFSERLFSRIFKMWETIKINKESFHKALALKYDQRVGQQYGTLLAGYAVLVSDDVLSEGDVQRIIGNMDFTDRDGVASETDEIACLNHLLGSKVRIQESINILEKTIGTFLDISKTEVYIKSLIPSVGVRVDDDFFYVANHHPALNAVFQNTRWANGKWNRSLARIKGTAKTDNMRFGGPASKTVKLPLSLLD
jgi:putative DNA primase/helicase